MKRAIGKNTIGQGSKMEVDLKDYGRSTHDLSRIWRSTTAMGTLIPFLCEVGLPKDIWDIDLECSVLTHPTIGPLFGSAKVQLDVYSSPMRLWLSKLNQNKQDIGFSMDTVLFPVMDIAGKNVTIDKNTLLPSDQINPSSILSYTGTRGIGSSVAAGNVIRRFNAMHLLNYQEIFKQYYANKQEGIGAYLHTNPITYNKTASTADIFAGGVTSVMPKANASATIFSKTIQGGTLDGMTITATGTAQTISNIIINTSMGTMFLNQVWGSIVPTGLIITCTLPMMEVDVYGWDFAPDDVLSTKLPTVTTFPLTEIDDLREDILASIKNPTAYNISDPTKQKGIFKGIFQRDNSTLASATDFSCTYNQEGLLLKTYQSDKFQNWMKTSWINSINTKSAIDTSSGSFTIDTLALKKRVYNLLNRVAISGGTYYDWIGAAWGDIGHKMATSPVYEGGLIKELSFQEVISQAETSGKPLGTLAGRGQLTNKKKGGRITINLEEPSLIMGIFSITPRLDYSQGNEWFNNLLNIDQLHKPEMDGIGFQDLITDEFATFDTTVTNTVTNPPVFKSAGKQPSWINYQTAVNRCYGNFAGNQMYMTFNRRYEFDSQSKVLKDLTTYIDPAKFNHIFAQTSRDAQNFWVQIKIDIRTRRLMSANNIPSL